MKHVYPLPVLIITAFLFLFCSCQRHAGNDESHALQEGKKPEQQESALPFCYQGISELKRGDFIVKPNLNILPGTSAVPDGYYFGHAAIVTKGATHHDIDSLLASAELIESTSRDLPRDYQVRETAGYVVSNNPFLHNDSFGPGFKGQRYRLRMNLTDLQIDSIIQFAVQQKGDISMWNAQKSYPDNHLSDSLIRMGFKKNWADNSYWYCALLIWQSVFYFTGSDLDPNGGYLVYPNDLINSSQFDNTIDGVQRRVRF